MVVEPHQDSVAKDRASAATDGGTASRPGDTPGGPVEGGRIATEALADYVVVTRSEHIPRIQEAQASAYHELTELATR